MFFSLPSPHVQILCSIERTSASKKVQAIKVNDELVPCLSQATAAGYWQCDNADLVIYVAESVLDYDLSRFPDIQALLTE
jgi:hypothetical protein